MTCSDKSDLRLFSLSGKLLAVVEPSGLQVGTAVLSCLPLQLACSKSWPAPALRTWGLRHAVHG